MRILYFDIDTLRSDHLGCYGYHRNTSPNLDALAARGIRFDGCYTSDSPCLPSRTALCTGRFGIRNGVVGHGGTGAELFPEGQGRSFFSTLGKTSFAERLFRAGHHTVTFSSFAQRHSAFHWHAGFQEAHSVGKRGLENADEVQAQVMDWLSRHGQREDWFAHVHLWDPHTPYRVPAHYGDPFAEAPLPAWLSEEVRAAHYEGCGPHSAREAVGFSTDYPYGDYPRQPREISSMLEVRRMFDGYDTGVLYADEVIGRILNDLSERGLLEDTAVIVSADHGETLGELNIYCDHHTADEHTAHVPFILCWPGLEAPRVEAGLCYQIDLAATVLELAGAQVPDNWDGESFASELRAQTFRGRDHLVLSQGAWTCQRAVRFEDYLYLRTYHDGYHLLPEELLFDLSSDPHEQHDLAAARPRIVERARSRLVAWRDSMLEAHPTGTDPLMTVLSEGGPAHCRGQLPAYLKRLRSTGRALLADALRDKHPGEAH